MHVSVVIILIMVSMERRLMIAHWIVWGTAMRPVVRHFGYKFTLVSNVFYVCTAEQNHLLRCFFFFLAISVSKWNIQRKRGCDR